MSLHPQEIPPVPDETMRVARAAFPRGNIYMRMRDALGTIYEDHVFAHLFPALGQPAASPWRLALTTVMQFAEGLSDRQAADAVRSRIDWKYALSVARTAPGFHSSVRAQCRQRLVAGQAEQGLLDALLERLQARGLRTAGGRARTDSPPGLAAVRACNRWDGVGEPRRAARHALAVGAPDGLRQPLTAEWGERYGKRVEASRFPTGAALRSASAAQIGAEGLQWLNAMYHDTAPRGVRAMPRGEILRQPWRYPYSTDEQGRLRWRTAQHRRAGGARDRPMPRRHPAGRNAASPGPGTKGI
jgi:transposase